MKTRTPSLETPPEIKKREDGRITQVRRYKLITPLFGGGVEPNQADPITVVRGTEIRGQLRFWWRATRGGQFDGDLDRMRQAEEAIWGSAAAQDKPGPSEVAIHAQCIATGSEDRPFEVVPNKNGRPSIQPRKASVAPPYAAFPLQPERETAKIGMETESVRVDVEFTLDISYPQEVEEDIQAALWAWETFGGLGARTRRGFGSLQLILVDDKPNPLPRPEQIEVELWEKLREYKVSGEWHPDVPHLSQDMRIKVITSPKAQTKTVTPIQVWNRLIQHLQNFRQKRHKRMGLSLWPEANEIRRKFKRDSKWSPQSNSPKLAHKFPRSVFGLPIIFHLPHDKALPTQSFTLQGRAAPDSDSKKTFERLSSALILKPLPCANGQAVGIAVVLEAPIIPPYGFKIQELPPDKQIVEWQLTKDEANSEPIREILHGQPDVIKAFLDSLD